MSSGAVTATAAAADLLAADASRQSVDLQLLSGDPVFLAFGGDEAVVDEGLMLTVAAPYDSTYRLPPGDYRAGMLIRCICDTSGSGVVGYVTS